VHPTHGAGVKKGFRGKKNKYILISIIRDIQKIREISADIGFAFPNVEKAFCGTN
jgi:hypothetical protein